MLGLRRRAVLQVGDRKAVEQVVVADRDAAAERDPRRFGLILHPVHVRVAGVGDRRDACCSPEYAIRLMLGSVSSVVLSSTSPVDAFDVSISGALGGHRDRFLDGADLEARCRASRNCCVPMRASLRSNVLKPATDARTV